MKKIRFENELILHLLTQKHLKELFGLECVASEKQLHGLRLDNLAFDEHKNSLVIIEYKNTFDTNVLNQAQKYYELVLDNENFFKDCLNKPKSVDFNSTQVMIIGPEFSDEQIREAKPYFNLWEVSLYDSCCVEYKDLKTNEIRTLKVNENDLKLTEDDLLKNKPNEICGLFYALRNLIKEEFSDIECKILVDEISLKVNGKIICNVKFLKKSFNVHFFAEEIDDEQHKLKDISNIGTGGKANFEFKIKSKKDLNYFMYLFKQTYEKKRV